MTEGERIQYIIDNCCGGSAITFARSIGIDKTRLSKIVHGYYKASGLYTVIQNVYPDVNPVWLRTGEGYPGDLSTAEIKARYEKIIAEKDEIIKTLLKVIDECLGKSGFAPNDQKSANAG